MNSYISLILAAERAKDLQSGALAARYRREARQARRAARRPRVTEQTVHGNRAPDCRSLARSAARISEM